MTDEAGQREGEPDRVSPSRTVHALRPRREDLAGDDRSRDATHTLSVIMAAYNEERTIRAAVLDVLTVDYPCELELIVVDDGSSDGTLAVLSSIEDPRMRVIEHHTNLGKGTALRTGRRAATGTYLVPFDADGEYSASDLAVLMSAAIQGQHQVVIGTRNLRQRDAYAGLHFAVGNRVLTGIANMAFGASISDMHSCLKLVSMETLDSIPLRQTGFGADTELVAALLKRGLTPHEVPISYRGRTREEGKKIGWKDAVVSLAVMGRHRLASIEAVPRARVVLDLTGQEQRATDESGGLVVDLRDASRHASPLDAS